MNEIEQLTGKLLELTRVVAEHLKDAESANLREYALTACVQGILRTAARSPETAALLAEEISCAAAGLHDMALGYAVTDDALRQRDETLRSMLPPELKLRVTLPTAP